MQLFILYHNKTKLTLKNNTCKQFYLNKLINIIVHNDQTRFQTFFLYDRSNKKNAVELITFCSIPKNIKIQKTELLSYYLIYTKIYPNRRYIQTQQSSHKFKQSQTVAHLLSKPFF